MSSEHSQGMSAITLNDDAWKAVDNTKTYNYYLDMKRYRKSGSSTPETPYTPSVSLMYAMREALIAVMEEGLESRIERHKLAALATRNRIKAMGLELFSQLEVSSNTGHRYKNTGRCN